MSCPVAMFYQLGNATSDPMALKIPQIPSSVLAALGLYSQSFQIINAVEHSELFISREISIEHPQCGARFQHAPSNIFTAVMNNSLAAV